MQKEETRTPENSQNNETRTTEITPIVLDDREPHKYAITCHYRAGIGPMLAASDQYRPCTGTYRNVYRDREFEANK